MSTKLEPMVTQHAEEEKFGQGQQLTVGEVDALIKLTLFLGFVGIILGTLAGGAVGLFVEPVPFLWALWGGAAAGSFLACIPALAKCVKEMVEGRPSYEHRKAQHFAPPQPQPGPALPAPPIVVKPYKGEPYVLGRGEPLALPDGRQSGLALNEPTIAAIIKEVITRHDGLWSRERLMGIKVMGERITRPFYEDLTAKLAHAGFLQKRSTGGFKLPDDVVDYDDLVRYFPNLKTRTAGRPAGRPEQGGPEGGKVPGRGVQTLAERRRQKFMELGRDVVAYLEWRDNHDS